MNIERGIWYRRSDGRMFGAKLSFNEIELWPLHPNTLEEMMPRSHMEVEKFLRHYCRYNQL